MELVKMSTKGQLVVPQEMREEAGFVPGDRFVPTPVGGGILFKRISLEKAHEDFRKLSEKIQARVKKEGIPRSVVDDAIRWARKQS